MNFKTYFFLILFVLSSYSHAQWWVDGGNVIWPHGDVEIPNGQLTLSQPPAVVDYDPSIFSPNTWWDSDEPCFRIMIDDSLGSDSNDGSSWSTAKKTIQGAIDALPNDLQGRFAFLFFHPGTYTGTCDLRFKFNGNIEFRWVAPFINTNGGTNGAYSAFVRNGAVDPIRDSSQVIFDLTPTYESGIAAYHNATTKFNLVIVACNDDFAYNVTGFGYWDKFVVRMADGYTTADNLIEFDGDGSFETRVGLTLDLNGTERAGIFSGSAVILIYLKVIGGSGTASTSSGSWNGVFSISGNKGWDIRPGSNYAWAVGYAPPISGKAFYISGVRNLLTTPWYANNFNGNTLNFGSAVSYTQGALPDTVHPYIRLHSSGYFSGQVTYNSDQVSLADNAVLQRIITDNATGITKYYYNANLYDRGDSLFYKGTAIAP